MTSRLLIITSDAPPALTGGTTRLLRLVRNLPRFGWSATIAGLRGLPHRRLLNEPLDDVHNEALNVSLFDRWKNRRSSLTVESQLLRIQHSIRNACKQQKFDVVLVTMPSFALLNKEFLMTVRRLCDAPIILEFRDSPFANLELQQSDSNILEAQISVASEYVRAVKCDTDALRDRLTQCFVGKPIMVIPNSFDPADFAEHHRQEAWPGRVDERIQLFYCGVAIGARAPRVLIPALKIASKTRSDILKRWRFLFVGYSTDEALGDWEELPGTLEQQGHLPSHELYRRMCHADVLFSVNLPSNIRPYMIRGKTLEYLGARRPVLNASAGPDADVIETTQSGIVVDPTDPQALSKAILTFDDLWLSNTAFKLGRSELSDRYTIGQITAQCVRLLEAARSGASNL